MGLPPNTAEGYTMLSNDVFTIEGFKNGAQIVNAGESLPENLVSCDKQEFTSCFMAGSTLFFRKIIGVMVCLYPDDAESVFIVKSTGIEPVEFAKFTLAPGCHFPMLLISEQRFHQLWCDIENSRIKNSNEGWIVSYEEDDRGNKVEISI